MITACMTTVCDRCVHSCGILCTLLSTATFVSLSMGTVHACTDYQRLNLSFMFFGIIDAWEENVSSILLSNEITLWGSICYYSMGIVVFNVPRDAEKHASLSCART